YEDDECDRHPGFRITQQFHGSRYLLRTSATAASIALSAGALPVSRSTIALAASVAMPCTLAIAVCLVPAMVFSASANLTWSWSSSFLRVDSASAVCLSRISLAIDCARLRASARDFS